MKAIDEKVHGRCCSSVYSCCVLIICGNRKFRPEFAMNMYRPFAYKNSFKQPLYSNVGVNILRDLVQKHSKKFFRRFVSFQGKKTSFLVRYVIHIILSQVSVPSLISSCKKRYTSLPPTRFDACYAGYTSQTYVAKVLYGFTRIFVGYAPAGKMCQDCVKEKHPQRVNSPKNNLGLLIKKCLTCFI